MFLLTRVPSQCHSRSPSLPTLKGTEATDKVSDEVQARPTVDSAVILREGKGEGDEEGRQEAALGLEFGLGVWRLPRAHWGNRRTYTSGRRWD